MVTAPEKVVILFRLAWARLRVIPPGFLIAVAWYWSARLLVKCLILLVGSFIASWCLRAIGFDIPRWWLL